MKGPTPHQRALRPGFTLVELLVSMTILGIILVMVAGVLRSTQLSWEQSRTTSGQYREARLGFETMTDRIAQAVLNPYWDNEFATPTSPDPIGYEKVSELHFISGIASMVAPVRSDLSGHSVFFQAPFGQSDRSGYEEAGDLLNAWGYVLQFGPDTPHMPNFVASGGVVQPRYRFRLMEFRQDTEDLSIYPVTGQPVPGVRDWFQMPLSSSDEELRVLAENVIALVILPLSSDDAQVEDLSPDYLYDSRSHLSPSPGPNASRWAHELPPLLRVTLVAVSEATVIRLQGTSSSPHPSFVVPSGLFQSAANYDNDLATLEAQLLAARVDYRVFTTTVPIRSSKWSEGN